jgi:hypothetical protein
MFKTIRGIAGLSFSDWVRIVSDAFLVMCVLLFMAIFYVAYFHDFRVLVTVNHFHEAHVEFVLFSLCFLLLLFRVFYLDRRKDGVLR